MGAVVVLGEAVRVTSFALTGATVVVAEEPEEVRRSYEELPRDTEILVLTSKAAEALREAADLGEKVLEVVMP